MCVRALVRCAAGSSHFQLQPCLRGTWRASARQGTLKIGAAEFGGTNRDQFWSYLVDQPDPLAAAELLATAVIQASCCRSLTDCTGTVG